MSDRAESPTFAPLRRAGPVLLLIVLGLLCYVNTLHNEFVWDDTPNIVQNRFLRSWEFFPQLFTADAAEAYDPSATATPFYRPLALASLLFDFQLWGPTPFGFHLTNMLLHIIGGLLVYALLRALALSRCGALLAAAVFIAHPLQTENVAYIAGRNAELSIVFMLASLLMILRADVAADQGSARRRWLLLFGAAIAFAAALLAKEVAVTFPGLIVAAVLLLPTDSKRPAKERWQTVVAMVAVLAGYLGVRALVLTHGSYPAQHSLAQRCLLALRALATAFGLIVAPLNLHHERSLPLVGAWATVLACIGAAALAGLVAVALWANRRDRRVTFGLLFFAITFSLTSNLIPLNTPFGERWIGWPMVGLLIALAAALENYCRDYPRRQRAVLAGGWLIVGGFVALTIAQNRVWRDATTLYSTIISRGGDTVRMHGNLGLRYLDAGQVDLARAEFQSVLDKHPDEPQSLRGMALVHLERKQLAEAAALFERARRAAPGDPSVAVGLAYVQEQQRDLPAAEQTLRAAAAAGPGSFAPLTLANFFYRQQRYDDAVRVLTDVLKCDPRHAGAHNQLGTLYSAAGRLDEAERELQLAVRYDRWLVDAHANLGATASARGDLPSARRHYERALKLAPQNAELYYALAVALADHGESTAARDALTRALAINPQLEIARKLLQELSKPAAPGAQRF